MRLTFPVALHSCALTLKGSSSKETVVPGLSAASWRRCIMSHHNSQRQTCMMIASADRSSSRRRRIPRRLLLAAAACCSSAASIAEASSIRPKAGSRTCSFALFPAKGSFLQVPVRLRGGGADPDGDQSVPPEGESSPPLDKDEASTDGSTAEAFGALSLTSLVPSLFQINNAVKYDASLDDTRGEDGFVTTASDAKLASSFTRSTSTNGRGGAMLVKPKASPAPPRRIFQWLAPLETDRVAPLADRLIVEDGDDSNHQGSNNRTDGGDDVAVRATSYVPYRASSRSNLDENPRNVTVSSNLKEQQDDISNEAESVNKQSSEGDSDRLSQLTGALEGSGEVARSSTTEAGNEETVDVVVAQLNEAGRDSNPVVDRSVVPESPYVSSGYWSAIDKMLTLGYADSHPAWKASRRLRSVRKATARLTGMHGLLSGKASSIASVTSPIVDPEDQRMGVVRRRIAEIARARENVDRITAEQQTKEGQSIWPWQARQVASEADEFQVVVKKNRTEILEEKRRKDRVKEIDKLMAESQRRLQDLACEKDVLQRRPNPLWNYTTDESSKPTHVGLVSTTRKFNFPPPDLIEEYLDVMFGSGKLVKLNHTDLWRNNVDFDDDEDDDDELVERRIDSNARKRRTNGNEGSGNWLLRYGLGEKIGEAAETAAYKSVCGAIMSLLARGLSSLHGVNVMSHSDIRLFMEQTPDLPPFAAGIIPGSGTSRNYAQGAIENAMRKGSKKRKTKKKRSSEYEFIQRGAVVETLLSHCQISAPLLKLFPLAWQRAMLANIITLVTSVIADFFEGLELHILGHRLSFAFTPITEADMLRRLGSSVTEGFNRHRARPEQFEAAVRATAADLEEGLKFLDKWHERVLGSGMLRTQIANLIARLVLTLVDDVLSGARMDLWTSHAGGPRVVAGLEYRTTPTYMDEAAAAAAASSP